MTNEEAIEDLLRHYTGESTDMAIKALIAIDNIKTEIENLPSELTRDGRRMIRRGSVFRIIDKHIREVMNE